MKKSIYKYIVGIDEVGRGPIAGPVSVCACVIEQKHQQQVRKRLRGITDSKQLNEQQRESFFVNIQDLRKKGLLDYAISHVSARVIDNKGISFAIKTALARSLKKLDLDTNNTFVYLDGSLSAPIHFHQETVIKGDQKIFHIAVASVIAKVLRDRKMCRYAKKYPQYGFERHKGYGTAQHRALVKKHGISPFHRATWII